MRKNRAAGRRCAVSRLRLMLAGSFALLLLVDSSILIAAPAGSAISRFSGGMRIGAEQFSVVLETQDRHSGPWVSVAVTNSEGSVSAFAADLDPSHPSYLFGGRTYLLDHELALRWSEELRSGFRQLAESERFRCTDRSDVREVFESQEPIALTEFLSARVRLVFDLETVTTSAPSLDAPRKRLSMIEIFSLPDWLNGFGDHVTLVLMQLKDGEGGPR